MLKEGQTAPAFKLKDQSGNDVSLSSFRGRKTVVYFYPKDHARLHPPGLRFRMPTQLFRKMVSPSSASARIPSLPTRSFRNGSNSPSLCLPIPTLKRSKPTVFGRKRKGSERPISVSAARPSFWTKKVGFLRSSKTLIRTIMHRRYWRCFENRPLGNGRSFLFSDRVSSKLFFDPGHIAPGDVQALRDFPLRFDFFPIQTETAGNDVVFPRREGFQGFFDGRDLFFEL